MKGREIEMQEKMDALMDWIINPVIKERIPKKYLEQQIASIYNNAIEACVTEMQHYALMYPEYTVLLNGDLMQYIGMLFIHGFEETGMGALREEE